MCFPTYSSYITKTKEMEEGNYIYKLISKFYKSNLSPEIQKKFQAWFLNQNFEKEKEEAMKNLWDKELIKIEDSTYQDLLLLHKRIDKTKEITARTVLLYVRRFAAILLLLIIGALGSYYYLQMYNSTIKGPELVDYSVPFGEIKQITLPDGTEVWINSGSMLVYDKNFQGPTRVLFLSGEANFKVAKNPEKPFIVKTKHLEVEALGTVFNIQSYADLSNTVVTLQEGKVKVDTKSSKSQTVFLNPNEQVEFNPIDGKLISSKVNANKTSRWKDGYLMFQGASFNEIVRTVERRFDISINYEFGRYTGRTFSIKFAPDENLENIMNILQKIVGFKYKIEKDKVFIY